MSGATILNVVSGKGGTGKTLLSCVLADMLGNTSSGKTIVIDLDFFVRGLTSLLYFHQDEKLQISDEGKSTVADFFTHKITVPHDNLAVLKYRSFDVVPAVARIDERLNFDDLGPNTRFEAKTILRALIQSLEPKYRFIILDSRAGYDELIAAAHELSTASICVEEQDPISRVTADNLIAQLSTELKKPVFRLINKARGVRNFEDIATDSRSITDLGVIPFDMDVLNSFGSATFWETVSRSLYKWALARSWNTLNAKLQLGVELNLPRLSPIASEKLEAKIGVLASTERILFAYGILLAAFGIGYGIAGREILYAFEKDPMRAGSFLIGLFGILVSGFAFLRKR